MIRFVYPNVNEYDQFAGCGRYLTVSPDDSNLTDTYTIADPNVGYLSKITTAASLLARNSFDSEWQVYECKDIPSSLYFGDSMGLAYLLALSNQNTIDSSKKILSRFFRSNNSGDVLSTVRLKEKRLSRFTEMRGIKQFFMAEYQIPEDRLMIKPYGKSKPLDSCEAAEEQRLNNRIEIIRIQ